MRRGARATSSRREGSVPTADDVTVGGRGGLAGGVRCCATSRSSRRCGSVLRARGFEMPACNAKQADFIVGARVLENPRGTAPGFWGKRGDAEIVILPGRPVRDEGDHGVERPARPARARGRRRRPAPRPAHRRDGGVGRRGARGAGLREVEGRSRDDPGVAGRGPAAPVGARASRARPRRSSRRWRRTSAPSSATASSARTPTTSRRSWAASCARAGAPWRSRSRARAGWCPRC